jgi:hypothetical protein
MDHDIFRKDEECKPVTRQGMKAHEEVEIQLILRRLRKLREASISFIMSVCLSVCVSFLSTWNNSAPTGRIFH